MIYEIIQSHSSPHPMEMNGQRLPFFCFAMKTAVLSPGLAQWLPVAYIDFNLLITEQCRGSVVGEINPSCAGIDVRGGDHDGDERVVPGTHPIHSSLSSKQPCHPGVKTLHLDD